MGGSSGREIAEHPPALAWARCPCAHVRATREDDRAAGDPATAQTLGIALFCGFGAGPAGAPVRIHVRQHAHAERDVERVVLETRGGNVNLGVRVAPVQVVAHQEWYGGRAGLLLGQSLSEKSIPHTRLSSPASTPALHQIRAVLQVQTVRAPDVQNARPALWQADRARANRPDQRVCRQLGTAVSPLSDGSAVDRFLTSPRAGTRGDRPTRRRSSARPPSRRTSRGRPPWGRTSRTLEKARGRARGSGRGDVVPVTTEGTKSPRRSRAEPCVSRRARVPYDDARVAPSYLLRYLRGRSLPVTQYPSLSFKLVRPSPDWP